MTSERIQAMAAVARAHPDWSIRRIEQHLNLKPTNNACAFKRGTQQWHIEQRDYAERLARYNGSK